MNLEIDSRFGWARVIYYPVPSSQKAEWTVTEQEFLIFQEDPVRFVASMFGMSTAQYEEWVSNDGQVRCAAIKRNGNRCMNLMSCFTPEEWLKRQGEYCWIHTERG